MYLFSIILKTFQNKTLPTKGYVSQAWELMNGREFWYQDEVHDGGREYIREGVPLNFNELNANNSCGHDEDHQVKQGKGQGLRAGHYGDKGVCNVTVVGHGANHWMIGGLILAYIAQLGKLDRRYAIILLLCLSLLVGTHIKWMTKVTVSKRKKVIVVWNQNIQVVKAR